MSGDAFECVPNADAIFIKVSLSIYILQIIFNSNRCIIIKHDFPLAYITYFS